MHIGVDVHNYMETVVGKILGYDSFTTRYDAEQIADLACIALSQLRPIYIRYDIDFLANLPTHLHTAINEQAQDAIAAAETMIKDDRRQNRDEDLASMVVQRNLEENDELDWFEKPILNKK
jgi:hypothetical protein